jgi:hypothetical protein
MTLRRKNNDNDSSPSLREQRIEQRRNYTDAAVSRGADQLGIARGTNRIYDKTFDNRPDGDRDDWSEDQQKRITVAEHFAANKVRDLPIPQEGNSQNGANDNVVEASGRGAETAREYCDDQKENGNFWTRLFS